MSNLHAWGARVFCLKTHIYCPIPGPPLRNQVHPPRGRNTIERIRSTFHRPRFTIQGPHFPDSASLRHVYDSSPCVQSLGVYSRLHIHFIHPRVIHVSFLTDEEVSLLSPVPSFLSCQLSIMFSTSYSPSSSSHTQISSGGKQSSKSTRSSLSIPIA